MLGSAGVTTPVNDEPRSFEPVVIACNGRPAAASITHTAKNATTTTASAATESRPASRGVKCGTRQSHCGTPRTWCLAFTRTWPYSSAAAPDTTAPTPVATSVPLPLKKRDPANAAVTAAPAAAASRAIRPACSFCASGTGSPYGGVQCRRDRFAPARWGGHGQRLNHLTFGSWLGSRWSERTARSVAMSLILASISAIVRATISACARRVASRLGRGVPAVPFKVELPFERSLWTR